MEALGDYFSIFGALLSLTPAESWGFLQIWPKFFRVISAEGITAFFQSFLHVVKRHSSVMCCSVSLSSLQRGNLVTSWLDNLAQRAGERMKGGGEGTEERREGNAAY